jgi:hypothetical protein
MVRALFAAFALVAPPYTSVQNAHQDQNRAAYAWESSPVSFVSGQETVEPELYKRPCQNTADDRQSDLCAQWKSADWAKLGTIVAAFGIGVLLFQIYFTIRALEHTGKATEAMERQNEIADETAKRQLRAYVIPRNFVLEAFEVGKPLRISFEMANSGQTPAHDVRLAAKGFISSDAKAASFDKVYLGNAPEIMSQGQIGAQAKASSTPFDIFGVPLDESVHDYLLKGDIILGVAGVISYRDIFKKRHLTTFKRMLIPQHLEEAEIRMIACGKGNLGN